MSVRQQVGPVFDRCLFAVLIALLFFAPAVESAVITVDTLADEDAANNSCSLREAIEAANSESAYNGCSAGSGRDRIVFSVTGIIALSSDLPFISDAVDIRGPGVDQLTIDGDGAFSLFDFEDIGGSQPFAFSGMTLFRGFGSSGPAINAGTGQITVLRDMSLMNNVSTNGGGAISAFGSDADPTYLTLERVSLIDNEAQGPSSGGGIRVGNSGVTVVIRNSFFYGNRATHENGNGGGMLLFGTQPTVNATIHNTTFYGNTASDSGGGLKLASLSTATITDSTFNKNTADFDGVGNEGGGGISTGAGVTTIGNTIVAGNEVGGGSAWVDLENTAYATLGYNFIGDNSGATVPFPAGLPNLNSDYVGTAAVPLDPLIDPPTDNGGPTMSQMPDLLNSPVIDTGSCSGSIADQRGYGDAATSSRIVDSPSFADADDGCDIGAVEAFAEEILGPMIFADGFESGDVAAWSESSP